MKHILLGFLLVIFFLSPASAVPSIFKDVKITGSLEVAGTIEAKGTTAINKSPLESFYAFKFKNGLGVDNTGLYFNVPSQRYEFRYLGNSLFSVNIYGTAEISSMTATSTNTVTNLNADMVDGAHRIYMVHLQDQKTQNTNGGKYLNNTLWTRNFNTEVYDGDNICTTTPILNLMWDGQVKAFNVGDVVTGHTSGATGEVSRQSDLGTNGLIVLTGVSGTFVDNEELWTAGAKAAVAELSNTTIEKSTGHRIVLSAGTYYCNIRLPFGYGGGFYGQCWLKNITAGTTLIYGSGTRGINADDQQWMFIQGVFTVVANQSLEIQFQTSYSNNLALGYAQNLDTEIFADAVFMKVL